MRVHFGLGAAAKIDWVEVRWPTGLLEIRRVEADGVAHHKKREAERPQA